MKKSDLAKRFREYIDRENLMEGVDALVVGLSGGPDSVCLFNLLSDISEEYGITLFPVHVHHGIRGAEADRDAEFSCEAAAGKGLDCEVRYVDVPAYANENGLTTEEAARILRYRELNAVCEERNADAIALAHHRGDQAETVLMNLFRGTGPVGLIGMKPRMENRIRPLLFAAKEEILEYLQENNIIYVEDSTNSDLDYTRNRIRSELLPLAEDIYPRAEAHIAALAEDIGKWHEHIRNDMPEGDLPESGRPGGDRPESDRPHHIDRARYLELSEANRSIRLRDTLAQILPGVKDVTRKHYQLLDDLLRQKIPGRRLDLPGRCHAVSTYEGVDFFGPEHNENEKQERSRGPESIELPVPGHIETPENNGFSGFSTELIDRDTFYKKKTDFFNEKDYTKFIDYDRIKSGLLLRHPREGDYLVIDGEGNRKKLNRFYIDRKIPREERAMQEVIADGSHIVWAIPDRISEYYKISDSTTRILKITRDAI